jgi:hypothetical protein
MVASRGVDLERRGYSRAMRRVAWFESAIAVFTSRGSAIESE